MQSTIVGLAAGGRLRPRRWQVGAVIEYFGFHGAEAIVKSPRPGLHLPVPPHQTGSKGNNGRRTRHVKRSKRSTK